MKKFPLSNAFKMIDESQALLNSAPRCGEFTNRSAISVHQAQELICKAINEAAAIGIDERTLYRLANERII